jgi:hypothetical protein
MKVTFHMTADEARLLCLYLSCMYFEDYLAKTEPHRGKEQCTKDAYAFRDVLTKVENAVIDAIDQASTPRRRARR